MSDMTAPDKNASERHKRERFENRYAQLEMTLKFIALVVLALTAIPGCDSSRPSEINTSSRTPSVAGAETQIDTVASKVPKQNPARGFLSSQACRGCHEKSHDSWYRSFHRTMTQLPSPHSIQAPFDGRKLTRGATTCSVERRGDAFWVTAPDPDIDYRLFHERAPLSNSPPLVEREVVLVTGSHHMQIFWLPSNFGTELRIFPWVFSIDEQRWIPYEDSFVTPPTNRRMRASWNANCIACHSVDGKPNFDFDEKRFRTEVVEFGISCEACHGPGESHVKWQKDARPSLPNMSELQFDFLAPETERHAAKLQAIDLWRIAPRTPARDAQAVLQQSSGELDDQAIRDLLQAQDRRSITLSE